MLEVRQSTQPDHGLLTNKTAFPFTLIKLFDPHDGLERLIKLFGPHDGLEQPQPSSLFPLLCSDSAFLLSPPPFALSPPLKAAPVGSTAETHENISIPRDKNDD